MRMGGVGGGVGGRGRGGGETRGGGITTVHVLTDTSTLLLVCILSSF